VVEGATRLSAVAAKIGLYASQDISRQTDVVARAYYNWQYSDEWAQSYPLDFGYDTSRVPKLVEAFNSEVIALKDMLRDELGVN
jgi:hypothetical protein